MILKKQDKIFVLVNDLIYDGIFLGLTKDCCGINVKVLYNGKEGLFSLEYSFGKFLFLNSEDVHLREYSIEGYSMIDNSIKIISLELSNDKINYYVREYVPKDRQVECFLELRNIKNLYHFTRIENIESILNSALHSKRYLENNNISYLENDPDRLDGHLDSISFSIEFPNTRYLNSKVNVNNKFVIIEYDANLIIKAAARGCILYSKYNAASNSKNKGKEFDSLISMYDSNYYIMNPISYELKYGQTLNPNDRDFFLDNKYPTHDQAEILIFNGVSNSNIKRIIFKNEDDLEEYKHLIEKKKIEFCVDSTYFKLRNEFISFQHNKNK